MTVKIDRTPTATIVTASNVPAQAQRVEIVPGTVREGDLVLGGGETVSGVVLTVRPA